MEKANKEKMMKEAVRRMKALKIHKNVINDLKNKGVLNRSEGKSGILYWLNKEEENLVNLVPIQIFYKYVEKIMYEIKDGSIGIKIRYLNENGSLKAKKFIKKMRKSVLSTYNYEVIKITDLIEK